MLDAIRKRLEKDEEGFTLIELMVVVLIIGILVAIAVPTFLKAQDNAKSKAATSNLRSGLSAAKTLFTENQTFTPTAPATLITELERVEPSLAWQGGASDQPEEIMAVTNATGDILGIANRSKAGFCYYIVDNVQATGGGTTYAKKLASVTSTTGCTAVTDVATFADPADFSSGPSTSAAGW